MKPKPAKARGGRSAPAPLVSPAPEPPAVDLSPASTPKAGTPKAGTPKARKPEPGTPGAPADVQRISDPLAMRAFAHPVRIKLMEALRREGPLTATRAAELLDDSPGNMSWHLQTLAKYGFVEEAGGGPGRSRPWQLVSVVHSFDTDFGDPQSSAASEALERNVLEHALAGLRQWWGQRPSYPSDWRAAAFTAVAATYLTADETEQLSNDIGQLMRPYRDRSRQQRPSGALPVNVVAFAHPLPPTPSGN